MNVLIVDDEVGILKIVGSFLRKIDALAVTEAKNGQEALDKIQVAPSPFSLIVTDLNMPELGGIDLIRMVRGDLKLTTPIFIMSGAKDTMVADAMAAGASLSFKKPVNRDELITSVKALFKL